MCVKENDTMQVIAIPDFYFDSLTDWDSVDNITVSYPFLTAAEANLVRIFHRTSVLSQKSQQLYNLTTFLLCDFPQGFSKNVIELFIEMFNFMPQYKSQLAEAVNLLAKSDGWMFDVEIGD
jgi:hypothetical protein